MRGGSVLRTDPRHERPKAEGECGVRPPGVSRRQTGRNGETDRTGKKAWSYTSPHHSNNRQQQHHQQQQGTCSAIITETTSRIEAGEVALVLLKGEFKDADLVRAEAKEALASAGDLDAKAASTFDAVSSDLAVSIDGLSRAIAAFEEWRGQEQFTSERRRFCHP